MGLEWSQRRLGRVSFRQRGLVRCSFVVSILTICLRFSRPMREGESRRVSFFLQFFSSSPASLPESQEICSLKENSVSLLASGICG